MAASSAGKNRRLALAVSVAVVWGLCFVLIRSSLEDAPPLFSAGFRSVLGGITLIGWIALSGKSVGLGLPGMTDLIFLSLANSAIAFGAMYLAAERAAAITASMLVGAQPLMLAIAGRILFGDGLGRLAGAGLALGTAGVTLIATTASGVTTGVGVALALVAAAAPTAGTIRMRRLIHHVDLARTAAVQFLLGGAILFVVGAASEDLTAIRWSLGLVVSLVLLGVAGTGVAYAVWFTLLEHVGLVVLGATLLLVPVVGVAGGLIIGERPNLAGSIGALIVLIGMGLVLWETGHDDPVRPHRPLPTSPD